MADTDEIGVIRYTFHNLRFPEKSMMNYSGEIFSNVTEASIAWDDQRRSDFAAMMLESGIVVTEIRPMRFVTSDLL